MWRLREHFELARLGIQNHVDRFKGSQGCANANPGQEKSQIDDAGDILTQDGSFYLSDTQPLWARRSSSKVRCCWPRWAYVATVSMVVIVVVFLVNVALRSTQQRIQHKAIEGEAGAVLQCGTTPTEAIARGCIYEPMMSSWMPRLCYFKDVADSYDDIFETWPWYADPEGQQSLMTAKQLAPLRLGNYRIAFTKPSGHDLHCLYTWRKLNYAIHYNKTWVDSRTFEAHHSSHCAKKIAQDMEDRDRPTEIANRTSEEKLTSAWPMLFHSCVPLAS